MLSAQQLAYLAWLALPEHDRRMTKKEYAELIGVHFNTPTNWEKNPEFQAKLKQRREAMSESPDFGAVCMRERTKNGLYAEYDALAKKAKKSPQEHQQMRGYATQLLDLTSHVERSDATIDYSDLSDEDLLALCMKWDTSPEGMTMAELSRAYERIREAKECPPSRRYPRASLQHQSGLVLASEGLGLDGRPVTRPDTPEESRPSLSELIDAALSPSTPTTTEPSDESGASEPCGGVDE